MFGLQGSGSRRVSVPHRTSVNMAGLTLARLQGKELAWDIPSVRCRERLGCPNIRCATMTAKVFCPVSLELVSDGDDGDLELLDLIECLKSTGMSLAEIKDFVDMTKQGDATLESRLAVFRNQRDVVKRQIAELRRRYIKLDVVITSGASCTSSMKINIPYGSSIFCLVCAECRISKWGFGAKYRISK